MSDNKDKSPVVPPVINEPGVTEQAPAHPSGRPKFDARGNAVWEWQTEDGEYSADVSTQRLKKLAAPELSLEDTVRVRKLDAARRDDVQDGGFNPYNHSAPAVTRDPDAKKQIAQPAKSATQTHKPVKDLKRLQEWMEMKQRLANQQDDD